jgi:hypothetical protein
MGTQTYEVIRLRKFRLRYFVTLFDLLYLV